MHSREETLDPVIEKENEKPKGESPLKTKFEATQVEAIKGELLAKNDVESHLNAIIEEPENKPKKKETKKKATEKMTKWEKNSNALQIQGYTSC
ncbi:hypothetical protein TB2_027317 [Malus domestica]